VHTILCRWSYLPLLFVVTPANCHEGPLAIPMFMAVVLLYHLRILIVRADAAYFNYRFLGFVHNVLHASVNPEDYQFVSTTTRDARANASWPTCSSRFAASGAI
jgi:hypothetical protein